LTANRPARSIHLLVDSKDVPGLWQHRTHFVANTRSWPPFCMTVDCVVAAIIAIEIAAGLNFR
jgi:hypothetical protein